MDIASNASAFLGSGIHAGKLTEANTKITQEGCVVIFGWRLTYFTNQN